MKTATIIFLLSVVIILGCATLDQDECLNANWYNIGYEDGLRGYSMQRISRHRKACAQHQVVPEVETYSSGHRKGVPLFCTYDKGLSVGSKGNNYPSVCSIELFPKFNQGFRKGKYIYDLGEQINYFVVDIEDLERDVDALTEKISLNENLVFSNTTSRQDRRQLVEKNKHMKATILDIHDEIYEIERRIADLEQEIENTR